MIRLAVSCLAIFWWLLLVPVGIGLLTSEYLSEEHPRLYSCYLYGYVTMFAIFEILAVPLILLQRSLNTLIYSYGCVLVLLFVAAAVRSRKKIGRMVISAVWSLVSRPWTIYAAAILFFVMIAAYVLFMSVDLDDSFYVAAASTAIDRNAMYTYSAYGGYYLGYVPHRYGLSPFPMLLAFFSQCVNVNPATMAHTVLPIALVLFAFAVYYHIAGELFGEDEKSKGGFLFFLALICIYSYYSVYTQGTFLLIRIWQGKAVLAGALLPFLFCLSFRMMREESTKKWFAVMLQTVCACCMVSSMGIALSPVMLGIFTLISMIRLRSLKRVPGFILAVLPCLILAACYLLVLR
ncbi:MAG: DUF6077 domain-containing protein [Eubacteriales bacterium]|nr:DUF6077 domain-containing protein [Eubacteriales bacterium]